MRDSNKLFEILDDAKTNMSIGNKIRKLLDTGITVEESYVIESMIMANLIYVFSMWRLAQKSDKVSKFLLKAQKKADDK